MIFIFILIVKHREIKLNSTVNLFENRLKRHPDFITDLILIGVFSAFSQIFIAFTIKNFGAVVFVIIMTTRSIPQVIFSWLVYHHYFGIFGWIGIVITFLTIGKNSCSISKLSFF